MAAIQSISFYLNNNLKRNTLVLILSIKQSEKNKASLFVGYNMFYYTFTIFHEKHR